jgi:hypothetical protein
MEVGVHSSNQAISRLSSLEMIPVHRRQRSHCQSDPAPDKFDSCFMGFPYQSPSWCRPLACRLQYGAPFAILLALFLAPVWLAAQPSARSITRRRVDNGGRTRAGCCGSNIGIPCAPGATSFFVSVYSFEHSVEVRIHAHPHSNLPGPTTLVALASSLLVSGTSHRLTPPHPHVEGYSLHQMHRRKARQCAQRDGAATASHGVNGVFAKVKDR